VRVGIDRIFAGIQRLDPHPFLAPADQVAMLERIARDILAFLADIGDDDPHVRDGHLRHIHHLDRREAWIDEIAAGKQHLFLQALAAFAVDEDLRTLKHVVPVNNGASDLPRRQGESFPRGNHADLVVRNVHGVGECDRKQERIDAVGARSDAAICGPRSPPAAMNAEESWNESHSTCRAITRPPLRGFPSRASITPILPGGTTIASARLTVKSSELTR
jgi:hypothetical protein